MDYIRQHCGRGGDFEDIQVIFITETWLSEDKTTLDIDGFFLVRSDRFLGGRRSRSKGGGVCCYIRETWSDRTSVISIDTHCCENYEVVSVSVLKKLDPSNPESYSAAIGLNVVYVPHGKNAKSVIPTVEKRLEVQEMDVRQDYENIHFVQIVGGDFNVQPDEIQIEGFIQQIKCSTRNERTIDLVFTKGCNYESLKCEPLNPTVNKGKPSDHNAVRLTNGTFGKISPKSLRSPACTSEDKPCKPLPIPLAQNSKQPVEPSNADSKILTCPICLKDFTIRGLPIHQANSGCKLKLPLPPAQNPKKPEEPSNADSKKVTCKVCLKDFTIRGLPVHQAKSGCKLKLFITPAQNQKKQGEPNNTDSKKVTCRVCQKEFTIRGLPIHQAKSGCKLKL